MSGPAPTLAATEVLDGMSGQLTYSTVTGTPVFWDHALVIRSQVGWSVGTNWAHRRTRSEAPFSMGNSICIPGTPYRRAGAPSAVRPKPAPRAAPASPAAPAARSCRRVSPPAGGTSSLLDSSRSGRSCAMLSLPSCGIRIRRTSPDLFHPTVREAPRFPGPLGPERGHCIPPRGVPLLRALPDGRPRTPPGRGGDGIMATPSFRAGAGYALSVLREAERREPRDHPMGPGAGHAPPRTGLLLHRLRHGLRGPGSSPGRPGVSLGPRRGGERRHPAPPGERRRDRRPPQERHSRGRVLILALAALVGVALGWARGGRLEGVGRLRLRGLAGLAVAAGLVVLGRSLPAGKGGPLLVGLGYLGATGVLWLNRRRPWVPVLLLGVALNALVIVAKRGHMPVSRTALPPVRGGTPFPLDSFHVLAGSGTPFAFLGDTFRLALGAVASAASPGDLVAAAGIAGLLQDAMRSPASPARS